ncbi:S-adenosylmethionine sensor upstream of mTORC1-like isoform X2 [Rhopilema esculentum]
MVSLAEIWESSHPPSENRIDWCVSISRQYFIIGGLRKILEKEIKGHFYELKRAGQCQLDNFEEFYNNERKTALREKINYFKNRKLRLLDVGSCYNPFSKFSEEFEVFAIDLCPATKDVFKADLLSLKINKCSKGKHIVMAQEQNFGAFFKALSCEEDGEIDLNNPNSKEDIIEKGRKMLDGCADQCFEKVATLDAEQLRLAAHGGTIEELPASSFDIVVLSLVLSYLPSPRQRWFSCIQANKLLHMHGLLCIIEPDSAHQNRNAHQIRAWKDALAHLGFVRYRYEKLPHLHCMAFRKTKEVFVVHEIPDKSDLMFIPQDFQDEDQEETCSNENRNEDQDKEISNLFEALPVVF